MKRVLFMMLLLAGIALSAQAQRRGYGPPGHHKHWKKEHYNDRRYYGYGHHGYYRDRRVVVCERPVVYERPVYVAPPPPPPPVVYYPARPRPHIVIDAGITIVH